MTHQVKWSSTKRTWYILRALTSSSSSSLAPSWQTANRRSPRWERRFDPSPSAPARAASCRSAPTRRCPVTSENAHARSSTEGSYSATAASMAPISRAALRWVQAAVRGLLAYFASFAIASAALPATTQLADPATTASSSNHRKPKSSIHSGKSGFRIT